MQRETEGKLDVVGPGKRKRGNDASTERADKMPRSEDNGEHAAVVLGAVDELVTLLDFSTVSDSEEISRQSEKQANLLLQEYHIVITTDRQEFAFEILELEFYLWKYEIHEDPFTHGSEEQKRSGKWYFHRVPGWSVDSRPTPSSGYRGGTRKGLDLTIGARVSNESPYFGKSASERETPTPRGGILIRTVRRLSDSKVISGPSLVVDEILRVSKASRISDLVAGKWNHNTAALPEADGTPSSPCPMRLIRRPIGVEASLTIYRSPRVGLDLANPETTDSATHPRVVFLSKPYRYFVHPHLLISNGRSQTFLGVYHALLPANGVLDDTLKQELVSVTGLKAPTVTKYLADYMSGYQTTTLRSFIGAAGKGASAAPGTYLKMMGAVDRKQHAHRSIVPVAGAARDG